MVLLLLKVTSIIYIINIIPNAYNIVEESQYIAPAFDQIDNTSLEMDIDDDEVKIIGSNTREGKLNGL